MKLVSSYQPKTLLLPLIVLASIFILTSTWYYTRNHNYCTPHVPYVDFDTSMQTAKYPDKVNTTTSSMLMQRFKELYKKHPFTRMKPREEAPSLPRIIHHVWLGGKMPVEYDQYYASWQKYHPHWVRIFWTDSPENYHFGTRVHSFKALQQAINDCLKNHPGKDCAFVVDTHDIDFPNKPFFDASSNYGERSDILKWEIVYRFGGMYVDTDFECLKNMDFLLYYYDFFTGIQPLDTSFVQLGAALFAAKPKHPILRYCVEHIKNNQYIPQIVQKTGPLHFTKAFFLMADKNNHSVDIALPASYFYPCSYSQAGQPASVWQKPESLAVHHWAGSWLKPEGFVQKQKR